MASGCNGLVCAVEYQKPALDRKFWKIRGLNYWDPSYQMLHVLFA